MRDAPYSAHERLVAPARPTAGLGRLVMGLALIGALTFALGSLYRVALAALFRLEPGLRVDLTRGATPGSLLLLLFGFGAIIAAVLLVARWLHGRAPSSLTGPPGLALRQFGRVLGFLILLHIALALLPPYGPGEPVVPNLDPALWFALLPLSLVAILVQTSSEELLFRGYLQQGLAARFSAPLVWMGLPALLFGLGHYQAAAGATTWIAISWAVCFGLAAADLTARAGTLGPAIAMHLFNNAGAMLLVAVKGPMSGLALATLPYATDDIEHLGSWMLLDFAILAVSWLVARLAIRR